MENTYLRKKLSYYETFTTALESIIYNQTSFNYLLTLDMLTEKVLNYYDKNKYEGNFRKDEIEGVIKSMAEKGLLLEINGTKLERMLEK